MGDSPSLLALHAMTGTIAVAPALPPGTVEGRAVRLHLDALRGDPRVVVAPTVMGRSVSNGAVSGGSVLPLPAVVELIGRHRKETAA
ncbi:MAG: hypothetical protein L0I24_22765 [Pseudonocardia sp.]|nr:hypothetical protein [Pseudonocardia sp.]